MSGPKLSAYELEQRKRAEIANCQSRIVTIKSFALSAIQMIHSECITLERHQRIIESSSISENEKELAVNEIESIVSTLKELVSEYNQIVDSPSGATLEDLKADCEKLSAARSQIDSKVSTIISSSSKYAGILNAAVEDLRSTMESPSFSIEEALAGLPQEPHDNHANERITDLSQKREMVLDRAKKLLKRSDLHEQDKLRVQKAIRRINDTKNDRELDEIASLVLGEIERSIKKYSGLLSEYQQLINTRDVLAASLGLPKDTTKMPENDKELADSITKIKEQIKQMEEAMLSRAEKQEISKCIDDAMRELGYELIGSQTKGSRKSRFTLYNFHGTSGLQFVQREDGIIRVQVVGLANGEHVVTDAESNYLLHEQENFCKVYEQIVTTLEKKGLNPKIGTMKKNPPNKSFNAYVNVDDYNPSYTVQTENTSVGNKRKNQYSHYRKPKNLTQN